MLPVFLDFPFLIAPSVFAYVSVTVRMKMSIEIKCIKEISDNYLLPWLFYMYGPKIIFYIVIIFFFYQIPLFLL